MDPIVGPDLDTSAMRAHFTAAISAYEEGRSNLQRNQVPLSTADFGEGFASYGREVIESLESLRRTTHQFLLAREQSWGSILSLIDDIEERDTTASDEFRGVTGR